MADINHRVGIKASPEEIYAALTSDEGLAKWWTHDTSGAGAEGSLIEFRFTGMGPDFEVLELIPNKRVRWKHSGNMPDAWMGTEVLFELQTTEAQTFVKFTHSNWQEPTDFMAHCSTKWAVFMLSLKDSIETGKGKPFPNDVQIDHS